MKEEINNIKRLISEVNCCLNNKTNLAALILTLIIPDACGNIAYESYANSIERYACWFDTYVGQYEQSPLAKKDVKWKKLPYTDGLRVYKLRCMLLHEASPSLPKLNANYEFEVEVNDFKLDWYGTSCSSASIEHNENGEEVATLTINVPDFCFCVTRSAEGYIRRLEGEKNNDKY